MLTSLTEEESYFLFPLSNFCFNSFYPAFWTVRAGEVILFIFFARAELLDFPDDLLQAIFPLIPYMLLKRIS